jgi:S-adenosylmethionine:tRNA ribosyltransferase-isomerase
VIKARFFGQGKRRQGRDHARTHRRCDGAICQIRASKAPKPGSKLILADAFTVTMTGRAGADGDFFVLELAEAGDFWELAERGKLPLPLHRTPGRRRRRNPLPDGLCPPAGAVAAPTAGLHFDEAMLATLADRGSPPPS